MSFFNGDMKITELNVGDDATGDTYFRTGDGSLSRIAIGTNGQVLTSNGTRPVWDDASGGGSTTASDISTGNSAVNIATTSGNITIDAQGADTDIIFKGTDSSSDITALTLDMSEEGSATFSGQIFKKISIATASTSTVSISELLGGYIERDVQMAETLNFPSVSVIISNIANCSNNTSFRLLLKNTSTTTSLTNAFTFTGGSGTGTVTMKPSSFKSIEANNCNEYLFVITNATGAPPTMTVIFIGSVSHGF